MWWWWVGNARMLVLKLIARGLGWGLPEPVGRGGGGPRRAAEAADQEEGTRQGWGAVLERSRSRDKAPA